MKRLHFKLLLIIFLCQNIFSQNRHEYIDESILVDSVNVPLSYKQYYIPPKFMPEVEMNWKKTSKYSSYIETEIHENKIDSSQLSYISGNLYKMKEPLLYNQMSPRTIYRFTWLRTFNNPVTISIEKDSIEFYLKWKVIKKVDDIEIEDSLITNQKQITSSEWKSFMSLVKKSDFWNMKRRGRFGEDGSEWILEGVEPEKYHAVSVWSPSQGENFYKTCLYLINLTDLNDEKKEIY